MNSTVLRATKAMDRESRQTRKERVAVVEAWQNEWGDQRYCSLGRKILRDTSESAKLVATGIGGLINAGFHGQYVCCRGDCRGFWRSESGTVLSSCWRLLTVIEWDCAIVMLNAVDGQRVGLCYRHAEGCWRPEWDCAIVKLKAVDGQRVGLCYRQAEGCWRLESGTVLSSCWRLLTVRVGLCYRQAEGCWRSESGTVLSSSWRLLTIRVGLCYRQAEVSFCLVLFRRASLVFSPFSPSLVCLIHSNKINRQEQKENHKIKRGKQST